jgi:hypothetical protein
MSEKQPHTPQEQMVPVMQEQFNGAEVAKEQFAAHLQQQAEQIPEIAQKSEKLAEAGSELIDEFSLESSLFEDEARSLVFTALANRRVETQNVPPEQEEAEQSFIADSMQLLAYRHSSKLNVNATKIEAASSLEKEEHLLSVFDKYTQPALTIELQKRIANGLFSDMQRYMGITAENEDSYEVRVLSIDPEGKTSHGLHSPPITNWEDLPGDRAEKARRAAEESELFDEVWNHQQGLQKRAEQMDEELGGGNATAFAWVQTLPHHNRKILCLAQPLAEKILYPELTENANYYDKTEAETDRALVNHEYVHTQGGVHLDQHANFGINAEERRAEYFSGDKNGYLDVKNFFQDIGIVADFSLPDFFANHAKGGTDHELYTELSQRFGVNGMLEILLASPNAYVANSSDSPHLEEGETSYLQKVREHIGGYDGVIGRMLEHELQTGKGAEIEARIVEQAKRVLSITDNYQGIFQYRKHLGLNVITDLTEQKVKELVNKAS